MELTLPTTNAEWLPFAAAAVAALLGLLALLAPRLVLRLKPAEREARAVAEARSLIAGFGLGIGVVGLLLFNQPFVQLALGASFAFAALGRLVSILTDSMAGAYDWLLLLAALCLAYCALAPVFGLPPA